MDDISPAQKASIETRFTGTRFSLFEPQAIDGISYCNDFITPLEESHLLAIIDAQPWNTDVKRWTQYYGGRSRDIGHKAGPAGVLPPWGLPFAERLHAQGHFPQQPNRMGVNSYLPGQGIGAHKDQAGDVIEIVAILSLGSALMFDFTRLGHETQSWYLQPRSLLTFQGEARHKWMHGITGRLSDRVGGLVIPRQRRVSVTFRCGALC